VAPIAPAGRLIGARF